MPGRMLTSITANERNASPMKAATKTISIVSARLSLPIMSALLRAAIADKPGDRDLVARMRLAHGVERLVELLDHRQQLAGVDVGNASRHHDGVLLGRDEPARQMLRQDVDIGLERRRDRPCRPSRRASAAASSSDQTLPTPACCLDDRVHRGNRRQRRVVVEARALREFDQHVDRIGAGELGVEPARCLDGLPLVRHLVGEAIARLERRVDEAEARRPPEVRSGCRDPDG